MGEKANRTYAAHLAALNEPHALHDAQTMREVTGRQPLDWEEWFLSQGARWDRGASSLSTNKVSLLIDAVLAGEGMMPGGLHMVQGPLRDGRLVTAHPAQITAGRGNFLRCQRSSLQRPSFARFVAHLLLSLKL